MVRALRHISPRSPEATGRLVLVEDRHLPPRHRPAHRPLAHRHEGIVGAQRIRLGEAVVVEHGDVVLLAKPADRLGVQRLAGRADDAEASAGSACRHPPIDHHRTDRRRGPEHVGDRVAREEVELLVRIEPALALVDRLGWRRGAMALAADRSRPPRPTRPFRGTPLRPARRGNRGTPRDRGCTCGREGCPWPARWYPMSNTAGPGRPPPCRRRQTSSSPGRASASSRISTCSTSERSPTGAAFSALVVTSTLACESVSRWRMPSPPSTDIEEQDRPRPSPRYRSTPPLSRAVAGSTTSRRDRRAPHPVRLRAHWQSGWRRSWKLAPASTRPGLAAEVLVDHRGLIARMTVADIGRDVVARGHLPAVLGAGLFVRS